MLLCWNDAGMTFVYDWNETGLSNPFPLVTSQTDRSNSNGQLLAQSDQHAKTLQYDATRNKSVSATVNDGFSMV